MSASQQTPIKKLTASDLLPRGFFQDRIIPPLSSVSLGRNDRTSESKKEAIMAERDLVYVASAVLIAARVSLMSLPGRATDGHQVHAAHCCAVKNFRRAGRDDPSYSVRSRGKVFGALNGRQNLSIRLNSQDGEMQVNASQAARRTLRRVLRFRLHSPIHGQRPAKKGNGLHAQRFRCSCNSCDDCWPEGGRITAGRCTWHRNQRVAGALHGGK
jgi:hypothetical protein